MTPKLRQRLRWRWRDQESRSGDCCDAFDVRPTIAMKDTAKGLALSADLTSIRRKRE
jgi:hypothetical protein